MLLANLMPDCMSEVRNGANLEGLEQSKEDNPKRGLRAGIQLLDFWILADPQTHGAPNKEDRSWKHFLLSVCMV